MFGPSTSNRGYVIQGTVSSDFASAGMSLWRWSIRCLTEETKHFISTRPTFRLRLVPAPNHVLDQSGRVRFQQRAPIAKNSQAHQRATSPVVRKMDSLGESMTWLDRSSEFSRPVSCISATTSWRQVAPWPQTTRRNIWWWDSQRCSQLFGWRLDPQLQITSQKRLYLRFPTGQAGIL